MFKIKLKTGGKKISFEPYSLAIKYLVDQKKLGESLSHLEKISNVQLSALQRKTFLSKEGKEARVTNSEGKPDELNFVKVKLNNSFTPDYFRNHLAGFIQQIKNDLIKNLHIFIPDYEIFSDHFDTEEYYYRSFIEGVMLGNYEYCKYKSEKKEEKELNIYFYALNEGSLENAIRTGKHVMEGVFFTRNLQNEPANDLYPESFADKIDKKLSPLGIKVKIFDEKEIKKREMRGLIAVGQGSSHPPRFIVIKYYGAGKGNKSQIALVGKGVTFDSGGISIKPAQDMWEMKGDMSGAAAVAGAIYSAAREKLPINIIGIIPAAENMLSGKAMRPGDIVFSASGKSIEIDNTDAEGRIILADALHYASEQKPDVIIDLATLTGHCVVALGELAAGLFTKDQNLSNQFFKLGMKTYERAWPLPMWDDYNQLNKSEVADVKNLGGRWGGAISAAKFLENFVNKKIPWIHIDIAGPAFPNNFSNYSKKFMTGFGVRLLFEYFLSVKEK